MTLIKSSKSRSSINYKNAVDHVLIDSFWREFYFILHQILHHVLYSFPSYSTHQTIRYTPIFSVHSYGTTCPRKNAITLEPLGLDFFLFSLSRSNDDLHFFYTWSCRRINPHGATVSFSLLGTPVFPHKRHVKTGYFKNRKKILRNKIVKSGLHTKIN